MEAALDPLGESDPGRGGHGVGKRCDVTRPRPRLAELEGSGSSQQSSGYSLWAGLASGALQSIDRLRR
jgi:hypothetical protein